MANFLNSIKRGQSAKPPRIMMIGVEGVGKSTAGACMPNPVFICGESGLVGPQFNDTASFTPRSWAEVLGFVDELAANPSGFKTLVIDTLDWLEPMLYAHVCAKASTTAKKVESIEDFGFGKGYVQAVQEARQLLVRLDRLQDAGFAVLILAHSAIKMFNNPTGDNYDRYIPKCNEKVAGLFREWCDAVLFAMFDTYTVGGRDGKGKGAGGQTRIVHTTHSFGWDGKNRYSLPEVMPLDMPTIMEAIGAGKSSSDVDAMLKELETLLVSIDPAKAEKTRAWVAAGKYTPQTLAQVINKCRCEAEAANLNENEVANA